MSSSPAPTLPAHAGARLDVDAVRSAFPALAGPAPLARFDAPGGSLVPAVVAEAVAAAMTAGLCQRGSLTEPQRATEATVVAARAAIGALLGADPAGVVFGRSMTALAFETARTLSSSWGPGDEIVVSLLDHDAHLRPWVIAAERAGATVRRLGFDAATAELDDVAPLLSERTRLVAVTGACNLFGTRPDVAAVAGAAHDVGALVSVDLVHLAPHAPIDAAALGADLLFCSPYKFFGPHLGALAAAPSLLETLHPDKLLPSTDAVPERFELGTLPYELLAGVAAAVDFIAGLAPGDAPADDLRARVLASMTAVEAHESALLERFLGAVEQMAHVHAAGSPAHRTPTVLLQVDGLAPEAVTEALAARDVLAPWGSFYALEASRHAGLGDTGGVRVGLAATTNDADVDRLLDGLATLA